MQLWIEIFLGGMSIYCFVKMIMFEELKFLGLDLEEINCQVKWFKRILEFEILLLDALRSSWKFVEHRGSFTPK